MKEQSTQPKWLTRVQEQSWEPEILISGIVLIILTQLPRQIDALLHFLKTQSTWLLYYTNLPENLAAFLKVAIYWTIFGLGVHLAMRSVWVSMVGLSYAFPKGIDANKLKYKGKFADMIDRLPAFPEQIQKLERACSTIYAIAFLMFMLMIGAFLGIVTISLIIILWIMIDLSSFQAAQNSIDQYINYVLLVLAVPYIIDFLTLGGLKRIKWLHFIYRPIYRLLSLITLSPIYRPVYYGLVSNIKKRYLIAGLAIYSLISGWLYFGFGNGAFSTHKMYPRISLITEYVGNFEDRTDGPISRFAHVPSDIIEGQVLPLFAVHSSGMEDSIALACNEAKLSPTPFPNDTASRNIACLNYFYIPVVDDDTIWEPNWLYRKFDRYNQVGLQTWLDLAEYERGRHRIRLLYRYTRGYVTAAQFTIFKESPKLTPAATSSETLHSTSDPVSDPTP